MPRTKAGKEAMRSMRKKYGEKAEDVYWGSIVKGNPGTAKWEGKGGTGKIAKAKRTYAKKHKRARRA